MPEPTDREMAADAELGEGFDDGNGLAETDPQAGVVPRPAEGRIEDEIPSGMTPEEFGRLHERRTGYGLPGDADDRPDRPLESGAGHPARPASAHREHPAADPDYRDRVMHEAEHIDPDVLARVQGERREADADAEAARRERETFRRERETRPPAQEPGEIDTPTG